MSDAAADESVEEEFDDSDEDGSERPGRLQRLQSLLPTGRARAALIGVLGLVVVAGGGAGAYFGGLFGDDASIYLPVDVVFYDLPEMVVNLQSGTKKPAYLKIHLSLELEQGADIQTLELLLPRVIDHFQVFLRELRVDDLSGSAGIYRIKEELLRRVSVAVYPVEVRNVLFKEMLIQ
ncbi:MAG: flagellar basal body-associated FliL family protein [Alphaproteobacteria bacterium]